MKIKAVLFDLDETLFDRKLAQKAVLALMMKQLPEMFAGLAPDPVLAAFLESDRVTTEVFNLGVPSDSMRNSRSKLFLQLLGLNENHAGVITKMYVKDYPTVKTPVDGAVPLVKKLSKNMTVGVVSNGLPDVQYTKLETLGLRPVFLYRTIGRIRRQKTGCQDFPPCRVTTKTAAFGVSVYRGFVSNRYNRCEKCRTTGLLVEPRRIKTAG